MSEEQPEGAVDLVSLVSHCAERWPAWWLQSEDLNVNLTVLISDGGVQEHLNPEVDVCFIRAKGEGSVVVEGQLLAERRRNGHG